MAVIWNSDRKCWQASDEKLILQSAGALEEYRAQLGGDPGVLIEEARLDFRSPSPKLLGLMQQALRDGMGIYLQYRSMSSPVGRQRTIYPTAVVRLSQRWHVRAWCPERREYRDFNLGRMSDPFVLKSARPADLEPDAQWEALVTVELVAHQELTSDVRDMVKAEYFGTSDSMRFQCRGALLHYLLQEARVAVDAEKERPPAFLLQVTNRQAIEPYLFSSSGA